ncbi:MAG: glutathione S-transferase family protein [Proteobacteria bacterium]|nr:glutathione S-transferase family protein [Pseudomonadota bacterium]
MTITYHDLAGADERLRFSPYCWRVRLALAHKGLVADALPWRFTDKEAIAFSGQERVPVLVDGRHVVADSFEIARYLDSAYPDRPGLFGGPQAEAQAGFLRFWCEQALQPALVRLVIPYVHACIAERDRAYFRASREARFGRPLEQIAVAPADGIAELRRTLLPLRATLERQPWLAGSAPAFVDYMVFGHFQFVRLVTPFEVVEPTDPVHAWQERLLDAYDGLARSAWRVPAACEAPA